MGIMRCPGSYREKGEIAISGGKDSVSRDSVIDFL